MPANAYPLILYSNRFLDAVPTATDTATGYSVSNIRDLRPFTFHQFAALGTKYVYVNCGSAKSADTIAFIGHNFFTAAATISVESSSSGAWAGEQVERLAGFTVTTDKAVLKVFATASAQWWRVKFVTAAVAAKFAVCILGVRLDFPRYPMGGFDPAPETLNAIAARSKFGYMIGATLQNIGIEIDVRFQSLTTSWIENSFRPAWDAHLSLCKPFFFAWDITNHATEVYFVNLPGDFTLAMPFDPFRRSLSLTMEGIKE